MIKYTALLLIICSQLSATDSAQKIFTPLFGPNPYVVHSTSGPGSNLLQTAAIREEIPKLIQLLNIKTMIDAPCGDLYWMKLVDLGVEQYTGIDVIQELVEINQTNYGNEKRQFLHIDMTKEPVPQADLIFCRDCLGHCSYEDCTAILTQFKKSGSKYLLTTTFPKRENINITTGDWYPINLTAAPFNLPQPILIINEKCKEHGDWFADKSLCLWKVEDIPDFSP